MICGKIYVNATLTFSYDANCNVVSVFYGTNRYYYQRNGRSRSAASGEYSKAKDQ